jgi:hypothetical protein
MALTIDEFKTDIPLPVLKYFIQQAREIEAGTLESEMHLYEKEPGYYVMDIKARMHMPIDYIILKIGKDGMEINE